MAQEKAMLHDPEVDVSGEEMNSSLLLCVSIRRHHEIDLDYGKPGLQVCFQTETISSHFTTRPVRIFASFGSIFTLFAP